MKFILSSGIHTNDNCERDLFHHKTSRFCEYERELHFLYRVLEQKPDGAGSIFTLDRKLLPFNASTSKSGTLFHRLLMRVSAQSRDNAFFLQFSSNHVKRKTPSREKLCFRAEDGNSLECVKVAFPFGGIVQSTNNTDETSAMRIFVTITTEGNKNIYVTARFNQLRLMQQRNICHKTLISRQSYWKQPYRSTLIRLN